jgi:hypothetical protein
MNKKYSSSTNKLIHQSNNERLTQTVVLLNRQYEIIQYLFSKREPKIFGDIENEINSGSQTAQSLYPVYEYIFSLIDNLVRYQKVLNVMPTVNQRKDTVAKYNKILNPLKEARNQIQHINNDIDNSFSGPLLGSVCWNKGPTQYIVSLGDIGRARSTPGVWFDTQSRSFVSELCYIYNETYHDLRKATSETTAIHKWLSSSTTITIDNAPYNPNLHFQALKLEVSLLNRL